MKMNKEVTVQKVQKVQKPDEQEVDKAIKSFLPQYLEVTQDLVFKDYGSRRTSIVAGEYGYVLDEAQIYLLPNASSAQKHKMIEEMMECYDRKATYALVCGYPCILMSDEYQILDYIPHRCCGELI